MGRTQTTKLPFAGKPIEVNRPTDAQGAALLLATNGKSDNKGIVRFFRVLEALVTKPADWTWMEDQMIDGKVDVAAFTELISTIFNFDWPDQDETESSGE